MQADISILFESPLLRALDVRCKEAPGAVSGPESTSDFEITFTRSGYFQFREGRKQFEVDTCCILFDNPGSEHVISHGPEVRDTCTVLRIPEFLLQEMQQTYWRKKNGNLPSDRFAFSVSLIPSKPAIDSLHYHLYRAMQDGGAGITLHVEGMMLEILHKVFQNFHSTKETTPLLSQRERNLHLETIERAKQYMIGTFDQELSLAEISRQVHSSVFHFSRIFKRFTAHSPYRYLMEIRLDHAARLLRDTSFSVTEVCFASGFNSFPHFIATFHRRFGTCPSKYCR